MMLFVAVCWCRVNRYKPYKWTLFRILHQNRVQNVIQWHNNNIWKQMCIKKYVIVLIPIFDTTYKGEIQVEIYMWALHYELVLFQKSSNYFCYVPDNKIERYILGWNPSLVRGEKVLGDIKYLMRSVKRAAEALVIWTEYNWDVRRVNSLYNMVYGRFNFKINKRFDSLIWSSVVRYFDKMRGYIIG